MKPERPTVVLSEYGDADVDLTLAQAQTLRRLSRTRLTVQPTDTEGRWQIKASSYVGTVVTPDIRILIKPKVPIANLFYLLEVNGQPVAPFQELFAYDRAPDLIPSFATFFAKHLDAALGRGVPRNYVEHEERLTGLRGRMNFTAQMRLAGLPLPVECRFDDYTCNIHLNRILKAAAVRLLRLPGVALSTRGRLTRHAANLEDVGGLEAADLPTSVAFTRLTEHCRPAEHLARVVLNESSLLDAVGTTGAAAFLIDMNKVFEDFVGSRLRRYLAGHLVVHEQLTDHLDLNADVSIRPDFIFDSFVGERLYVSDCKYKVTTDGFGRQADYYQLNAYARALNLPEGLLIYCQTDGQALPREIKVRHGGPRLCSCAVRLDGSPSSIEAELRQLAADIMFRVTPHQVSGLPEIARGAVQVRSSVDTRNREMTDA